MSVTFTSEMGPITGFRIGCCCETNASPLVFGTYADAEVFYKANNLMAGAIIVPEVLTGCQYAGRGGYCELDRPFIQALEAEAGPEVNVSNGNAIGILQALGLAPEVQEGPFGPMAMDACGGLEAQDFLGRVLMAQALSVGDPGRPQEVSGGPGTGQARMVACGTSAGYIDGRFAELREVAEWCLAKGRKVQWS
jgi:hypothetical protein